MRRAALAVSKKYVYEGRVPEIDVGEDCRGWDEKFKHLEDLVGIVLMGSSELSRRLLEMAGCKGSLGKSLCTRQVAEPVSWRYSVISRAVLT